VDRAEKREFVAELNGVFTNAGSVVVAHYAGLTVAQMNDLGRACAQPEAPSRSRRTALPRSLFRARSQKGLQSLFEGQTLIAYSDDPVTAPKIAVEFAKVSDKLVILGGAMGATTLNADGVKALATMPSLDELRAKIVGMIQTPATRIAQIVNAPAGAVARVIGAHARKDEAA
jgi:large subunit ribosomal protein L10